MVHRLSRDAVPLEVNRGSGLIVAAAAGKLKSSAPLGPLMSFAMHPEQNANQLVLRFLGSLDRAALKEIPDDAIRSLRNSIRESLRAAVEREREACAAVIEQQTDLQRAAAAIRARSKRASSQSPTASGSSAR